MQLLSTTCLVVAWLASTVRTGRATVTARSYKDPDSSRTARPTRFEIDVGSPWHRAARGLDGRPSRLFGCNLPHYLPGVGHALAGYSDAEAGTFNRTAAIAFSSALRGAGCRLIRSESPFTAATRAFHSVLALLPLFSSLSSFLALQFVLLCVCAVEQVHTRLTCGRGHAREGFQVAPLLRRTSPTRQRPACEREAVRRQRF
jgi:hypothetical protein